MLLRPLCLFYAVAGGKPPGVKAVASHRTPGPAAGGTRQATSLKNRFVRAGPSTAERGVELA
jgi:hypothetical protein